MFVVEVPKYMTLKTIYSIKLHHVDFIIWILDYQQNKIISPQIFLIIVFSKNNNLLHFIQEPIDSNTQKP